MTALPYHWPALVATVRMARGHFDQRAYRSTCGCVHFYPSHCWRCCAGGRGEWYDDKPMNDCASMYVWEQDFTGAERLTDAEAAAIWDTRPKGDGMTFTPHADYMNAVFERHPQSGIELVYETRDLVTGRLYHWCAVPMRSGERRGYTAPTREEAIRLALEATT